MTPIRTNKPLFFNSSGEPLNGTIWIGQPSQDPRTNPKAVTFRDAGGSEFTAKQPLDTLNGRIVYNGKPIVALVDGEFSMLTFDSSGAQVDYSRSVNSDTVSGSIADFSQVARIGLTLDEIKAFDVSVGEVVRNVGEVNASDKLGAFWLAVSATGNAADDVDLIDFTNGLQGKREESIAYRRDTIQTGEFVLDSPSLIVSTNDATAYRNVWTSIDISGAVPDEASSARIRLRLDAAYPTNTISNVISVFAAVRKDGETAGTGPQYRVGEDEGRTDTNSIVGATFVSEFTIPLASGSNPQFDVYVVVNDPTVSANNTAPDLDISVISYTINQQDID